VTAVNLSHEEISELLGAYALDAVDEHEFDAIELHLRDCPRCRDEVETHREVAAMLAHSGSPAPSGVWDRIVASLDNVDEAPAMRLAVTPLEADDRSGRLRTRSTDNVTPLRGHRLAGVNRWVLGAAAVVVLVLGVSMYRQGNRLGHIESGLQSVTLARLAEDVHQDPTTKKISLESPDKKLTAQMALHPDGHGFLRATTLPKLPDGRTYQLWAINADNEAISLGLFNGGDEAVTVQAGTGSKAFVITEEKAGGVIAPENVPRLSGSAD
jgi:anti-sigma-K factor RskA